MLMYHSGLITDSVIAVRRSIIDAADELFCDDDTDELLSALTLALDIFELSVLDSVGVVGLTETTCLTVVGI